MIAVAVLLLAHPVAHAETLTVAVAANVKFAFDDLAAVFKQETGIDIQPVYGSSGKITAQVKEGAPYDVFLSADMEFPTRLYQAGQAVTAPKVYAYGKLVLWTLNDTLDLQYTGFVASHIVIFLVAYVGMEDVNTGWLAINVWHNFQYVLVVWMSNAERYANGIDPAARFLSRLSQPGRVMKYFACCLAITTLLYAAIDRLTVLALGGGMAATLGVYMGLNFHHHIVNALIWKRRKAVPQG